MNYDIFRDFDDGEILSAVGFDIVVQRRTMGRLHLPTGKLVACDPLEHPETEPFEQELPPGDYPVRAILAQLRDEQRIAYAVLEVRDTPATRWQLAGVHSEEEEHVYTVVSSIGAFLDASTATRLMEYTELALHDEDEIEREMRAQFRKRRPKATQWANIEHAALGPGNLIAFTSGFGDGAYKTYFGLDMNGHVSRVVTDFEVLNLKFPSFPFRAQR